MQPVLAYDGTDKSESPAGDRWFRALSMLVKQKRLAKTPPTPCIAWDARNGILAKDDFLAENVYRVAVLKCLH